MNLDRGLGARIALLAMQAYETAKSKGWHDPPRSLGEMLALVHSEVSEALEAYRKEHEWRSKVVEELADVVIRVFDTVGALGAADEFGRVLLEKMERNERRPHRHGGRRL